MLNPFRSQNVWIKATAISAAALTISLGLCGLNLAAFSHYHLGFSGPHVPGHDFEENLANALIPLGLFEGLAIVGSALCLIVSLVGLLTSTLMHRNSQL